MIRDILDSLKWSSRLGAKFLWAVPTATSGVVLFTLVSQLSMLLAFFLPLKVIILLGSDGIPRYFPPAFEQFDRDALIVWLSIATVAFYALYLLADGRFQCGCRARRHATFSVVTEAQMAPSAPQAGTRIYQRSGFCGRIVGSIL